MPLPPLNLRFAVATLVAAAACAGGGAQPIGLSKNSPFMPPAGLASPTTAASETIDFAGVSSMGKRIDLIFHDKSTKKSHWIGIGETKEGISVLNYDPQREQAVIKLNGVEKVLSLRKGTGPANAHGGGMPLPFNPAQVALPPAPAPAVFTPPVAPPVPPVPVAEPPASFASKPAAPAIPESQLKAETEARMLVSDLLEIGMAQRKAYEDAQRRASEGNPAPTPPVGPARQP